MNVAVPFLNPCVMSSGRQSGRLSRPTFTAMMTNRAFPRQPCTTNVSSVSASFWSVIQKRTSSPSSIRTAIFCRAPVEL